MQMILISRSSEILEEHLKVDVKIDNEIVEDENEMLHELKVERETRMA